MGLDMYIKTVKTADISEDTDIDFEIADTVEQTEFMYWRKHYDLHGFMTHLYAKKGGKQEFNRINMRLREADLDELEKSLKEDTLKEDLISVKECRNAILGGCAVIYSARY